MYSGEKLSEAELRYLATGYARGLSDAEIGEYEIVDEIEGDSGRWTKYMTTVIQVGEDLWAIDWQQGLTECQENEFYEQPYRVERKERVETIAYYEAI